MDHSIIYIAPIFLIIALIYAMAGQGGGSAYLATMALFGVPSATLPPISLSCNIVATIGIAYQFTKAGYLKKRLVLPFLITSIPAAFIGGRLEIPERSFMVILIGVLIITSALTFFNKVAEGETRTPSIKEALLVGSILGVPLGLTAGMAGIGGGIFLLPIILLLKWGDAKQAALASGLFTLINSISGLAGHGLKGSVDLGLLVPLILVVAVGSQIGARLGAKKLPASAIQKIFAAILLAVAVRLAVELYLTT